MKGNRRTADGGRRTADGGALAGLLLCAALAPGALDAQRVIVRERTLQEEPRTPASRRPSEGDVVQWVRQLQRLQEREMALVIELRSLGQDEEASARRRAVELELRDVARNVVRIRSGLDAMCERAGDEPEGWMGLTFTGSYRVVKRNADAPVFTFLAYPVIEAIEPGSPAAKAGVAVGDTLVALNRRDLRQGDVVFAELLRPGSRLPMRLVRAGNPRDVTLRIVKRPGVSTAPCRSFTATAPGAFAYRFREDDGMAPPMAAGPAPRAPQPRPRVEVQGERILVVPAPGAAPMIYNATGPAVLFGAELTHVGSDLGEVLGVSEGVLVTSVLPGGPAAAAGLRGGDVIVRAGEVAVTSPRDLQRARWDAEGREIPMEVVRKKRKMKLSLRW